MQHTITFSGKKVALYEFGSAENPTILLIHGNSVHAGFFRPLISNLENRYHLVTFDLPGCGASEAWKKEEFTGENLARLCNSVLGYFGVTECNAFGFSMGAFILLEILGLLPAVRKIAISGHPPLRSASDMQNAYLISEDSALFLQGVLSDDEIKRLYEAVIGIREEEVSAAIMESVRQTDPSFREGSLNLAMQAGDQVARLQSFKGETAIIHPADDKAVRADYYESLPQGLVWNDTIQTIGNSGHFVIIEQPAELAKILDRFFTGN